MITTFEGMEVYTNPLLTETKVVCPKNRFIEYEKKDEWWLLKYGFAKIVTVPSQQIYILKMPVDRYGAFLYNPPKTKDVVIMHPDTWDKVRKELEKRKRQMDELCSIPQTGFLYDKLP